MKAVILSAGEGKRLKPTTDFMPKTMIKISGKPIIEYIINDLLKFGFNEICIVIGHRGNQIKSYFGDGTKLNAKISYVVQKELKGTANATNSARNFVCEEPFLLHLGDAINPGALEENIENMLNNDADINILSTPILPSKVSKVGNIETDGNNVIRITEKSPKSKSNLSWAGVAVFKSNFIFKIIDKLQPSLSGEYEITEAMNNALSYGFKIRNHVCKKSIDAGTMNGLEEVSKYI